MKRFLIGLMGAAVAGGGSVAGYAFIDAHGCGATVGPNTTVSTTVGTSSSCHVNFLSVDYPTWDAFVAAVSAGRIAQGHFPFIIADGAVGSYAVKSIVGL